MGLGLVVVVLAGEKLRMGFVGFRRAWGLVGVEVVWWDAEGL